VMSGGSKGSSRAGAPQYPGEGNEYQHAAIYD
jgi:hypothetical protein